MNLSSRPTLEPYAFFLGGPDLEMLEIKRLIESHGYTVQGPSSSWAAADCEIYRDALAALPADRIPVLVELKDSRKQAPARAIFIDHHGDNSGSKPSSLEQVAELLGLTLIRRQLLIAANDRGWIPAMQELRASTKEIEELRREDRRAQGISPEEEARELEGLPARMERVGAFDFIQSKTERTSIICDHRGPSSRPLAILAPSGELNVFGDARIIEWFEQRAAEAGLGPDVTWKGGALPGHGYWGIKNAGLLTGEPFPDLKALLCGYRSLHSQHLFLLPFRIEKEQAYDPELAGWQASWFQLGQSEDGIGGQRKNYTEYVYFLEHMRKMLFPKPSDSTAYSRYYTKINPPQGLTIEFSEQREAKSFQLEVKHLALRRYGTDLYVFAIELNNCRYPELDDIILINEGLRRIFPQFIGQDGLTGRDSVAKYMPQKLSLYWEKGKSLFEQLDEKADKERYLQEYPELVCGWIANLLGIEGNRIQPLLDDRMFTICRAVAPDLAAQLQKPEGRWWENPAGSNGLAKQSADAWCRFLFIDSADRTIQNDRMLADMLSTATYARWSDYGTFFGASRYSFVCLDGGHAPNCVNIAGVYYQMIHIVLAQRAAMSLFSGEVTAISERLLQRQDASDFMEIRGEAEKLNLDYLHFTSQLWTTEISSQEQGIELFSLLQEQMNIQEQFRELRAEIKDLHAAISLRAERWEHEMEKKNAEAIDTLTKVSFIFLPLSLVVSIWQFLISLMPQKIEMRFLGEYALAPSIMLALFGLSSIIVLRFSNNLFKKHDSNAPDRGPETGYWSAKPLGFMAFLITASIAFAAFLGTSFDLASTPEWKKILVNGVLVFGGLGALWYAMRWKPKPRKWANHDRTIEKK